MATIAIVGLIWIVCGVLVYGLILGYYQRKYPMLSHKQFQNDRQFACFLCVYGPFALCSVLLFLVMKDGRLKHGLMFRVKEKNDD